MKNSIKLVILFFCFIFFGLNSIFSQENTYINKTFVVLQPVSNLSQQDVKKIENFNYDDKRFYTLRKKIQIERGPLIELLSIKELEDIGYSVSKDVADLAKSKSESFKHESVLNLNLGIGIYPAYEPK